MTQRTTSAIAVAASRAEVMAVIADFAAYPTWVDAVKEAEVLARGSDGRPAQVRFVLDAGVVKDEYVLAFDWDDDTAVRWHLVRGKVLTAMDGSYVLSEAVPEAVPEALSAAGAGATEVTYTLSVDVAIRVIGMIKRKAEKVVIDTALTELKRRVESRG